QTLTAARDAWRASREPYLQTEVYRFYDGPIDNPDTGPEGLLNAWPLDENYIDYTATEAMAGIVNDTATTIDGASLESLNEKDGEKNLATGYHAIEFLLWGQDTSDTGPGERPHTDFLTDGSGTAANQDRRGQYVTVSSTLMLSHLQQMVDAWSAGSQNYRQEFEALDNAEAMRRILTGMIVLSGFETGGERLQTALDSGEQEDEHSCFSDNTHRDMIQDIQGIQNVWLGSYTRIDGSVVSGAGVKDVVEATDTMLAGEVTDKIAESLTLANAMQVPFDQEIKPGNTEGNARVRALVVALTELESLLEQVFLKYGLEIPQTEE
ncbi:MAG: imelysin family protein, partial [Myxococcota bacterium]